MATIFVKKTPKQEYNSLTDPHLAGFFSQSARLRTLKKNQLLQALPSEIVQKTTRGLRQNHHGDVYIRKSLWARRSLRPVSSTELLSQITAYRDKLAKVQDT